jgi:AbiV family abortive infection protein
MKNKADLNKIKLKDIEKSYPVLVRNIDNLYHSVIELSKKDETVQVAYFLAHILLEELGRLCSINKILNNVQDFREFPRDNHFEKISEAIQQAHNTQPVGTKNILNMYSEFFEREIVMEDFHDLKKKDKLSKLFDKKRENHLYVRFDLKTLRVSNDPSNLDKNKIKEILNALIKAIPAYVNFPLMCIESKLKGRQFFSNKLSDNFK